MLLQSSRILQNNILIQTYCGGYTQQAKTPPRISPFYTTIDTVHVKSDLFFSTQAFYSIAFVQYPSLYTFP